MRQLRRSSLLHVSAQLRYTTPTRATMVPWTSATMDAVVIGEEHASGIEKMEMVMVVKLILLHDLKEMEAEL
ncbi:hypothetical protein DY000_02030170 [Brassica cretica]|uniref:Uncharacterized protein n=1 Tax=Brassica cretica TaxID=69181 RepID=A0ABQ7DR84_BRACR|nr:hypothetical protein DY000_02030170 [Brassica cretica]